MESLRRLVVVVGAILISVSGVGNAQTNGQVAQLSGTLSVQKPDGSIRILSQKSDIQSGDTINTQRDSYAQVRFPDGAQITLKPNTSVKIESFNFTESEPQRDNFIFGLLKGGAESRHRAGWQTWGSRCLQTRNRDRDHRNSRNDLWGRRLFGRGRRTGWLRWTSACRLCLRE